MHFLLRHDHGTKVQQRYQRLIVHVSSQLHMYLNVSILQAYLDVVIAIDKACIKQSVLVKELVENKINKSDLNEVVKSRVW